MPVTASWMAALTSAMAWKPRRVTRRARLRMLKATTTIATEMPAHGQRQLPGDREQHDGQDHQRQHLADDVGDQHHDLGELLGVGGDAADDAAGAELVEERHVVADHRLEGVHAQVGHDHAGDALQQPAAQPVDAPNEQADGERDRHQGNSRAGAGFSPSRLIPWATINGWIAATTASARWAPASTAGAVGRGEIDGHAATARGRIGST